MLIRGFLHSLLFIPSLSKQIYYNRLFFSVSIGMILKNFLLPEKFAREFVGFYS